MERQPVTFRAEWDEEASVWWVAETSYPGLNTEAPTPDVLVRRVRAALDLLHEGSAEPSGSGELVMRLAA